MIITEAIYKLLDDAAGIEAPIYYGNKPQNTTTAAIVLELVADIDQHTFDGYAGWSTGSVRINCFSPTYLGAHELMKTVRAAINGYQGDPTSSGDLIFHLSVGDFSDIPAVIPDGAERPVIYGVTADVDQAHSDS